MISWSSERQTNFVTPILHFCQLRVTTYEFFLPDSVSIIGDGDVPFQTAMVMVTMPP